MRKRDEQLSQGWGQIVTPLSVETAGGKQKLNCANAQGLLRIIQSIPSPKAEPFKLWLAKVGSERLEEIENPELATQRTREIYKLKGYPGDWIEKRMRSIAIREELTINCSICRAGFGQYDPELHDLSQRTAAFTGRHDDGGLGREE